MAVPPHLEVAVVGRGDDLGLVAEQRRVGERVAVCVDLERLAQAQLPHHRRAVLRRGEQQRLVGTQGETRDGLEWPLSRRTTRPLWACIWTTEWSLRAEST